MMVFQCNCFIAPPCNFLPFTILVYLHWGAYELFVSVMGGISYRKDYYKFYYSGHFICSMSKNILVLKYFFENFFNFIYNLMSNKEIKNRR